MQANHRERTSAQFSSEQRRSAPAKLAPACVPVLHLALCRLARFTACVFLRGRTSRPRGLHQPRFCRAHAEACLCTSARTEAQTRQHRLLAFCLRTSRRWVDRTQSMDLCLFRFVGRPPPKNILKKQTRFDRKCRQCHPPLVSTLFLLLSWRALWISCSTSIVAATKQ